MKRGGTLISIGVCVVILAVAGIVTALMFVRANTMRDKAHDLDRATAAAQTAIESFKAGEPVAGTHYFDHTFSPVESRADATLEMDITLVTEAPGLYTITVTVSRLKPYWGEDVREILTLSTAVYKGA